MSQDTRRPKESREDRGERRRSSALRATLRKFRDSIHKRIAVLGEAMVSVREDTARAALWSESTDDTMAQMRVDIGLVLQGQQRLTKIFTDHIENHQHEAATTAQQPEERPNVE